MTLGSHFWRFGTASALSNLADGVFAVALPLLAVRLTDSPLLIAGVTVAAGLPWLLFVLIAGALADRLDRRRTMLAVTVFRATMMAVLAALTFAGALQLWMLYLAAALIGVAETLFDTAAQSVLPMLVPREQLSAANSRLYGLEVSAQSFAGPPLGGLLAGLSLALAFSGSALGFIIAGLALLTLRGRFRAPQPQGRRSLPADIREGLSYLWGHALLRRLALLAGAVSLAFNASNAVLVLYAVSPGPMGLSGFGYGALLTSIAAGALAASLVAERIERALGRARSLRLAVLAIAVFAASPLLAHPLAVAPLWALGGFSITLWNVITVSLRQRLVPEHLLGRVNSAYRLLAWGGGPIGAAIGGVVAQAFGLPVVFALAGLVTLILLPALRPLTEKALADPVSDGDETPKSLTVG